jgi:DNA-binding LacI/PurR family transcriptional regulator
MIPSVTMDDVAAKVGVSRATVSLALRRSPKISAKRTDEVWCVAREMGFFPNVNASRLARARQSSYGVLLADLHNPIMAEILDGFAPADEESAPDIYLASGFNDVVRERKSLESFLSHRVAGVVLVGSKLETERIQEFAASLPTVAVGRNIPGVDSVLPDSQFGGRLVADHFLDLGHLKVAHIDGGSGAGAHGRKEAFLRRFRSIAGAATSVLPGDYTQASGYEAAKALFASGERPTALFAANDLMALGAMGAAREKGLIAGVDFALCGFDDIEVAAYGYISLTTVSYSRKEGGAIARELLQQRCTDPTRTPKVVKVRPRLLVRNTSCACNEETIVVDSDLR